MTDAANYAEVHRALQESAPGILLQIPVLSVHLYLPLDGRGARICAGVEESQRSRVPSHVDVKLDGRTFKIPIEAVADHQQFEAY